ncbi:hypothetical protein Trydic_g5347 [Trypoxylus dichotomus]
MEKLMKRISGTLNTSFDLRSTGNVSRTHLPRTLHPLATPDQIPGGDIRFPSEMGNSYTSRTTDVWNPLSLLHNVRIWATPATTHTPKLETFQNWILWIALDAPALYGTLLYMNTAE